MHLPLWGVPVTACQHENFAAHADVARLTNTEGGPVEGYSLDLRVECADCHEPFCFRAPMGISQFAPTASLDGTVLTAPIHPMSDPTAGIGLPGFSVRFTERDAR